MPRRKKGLLLAIAAAGVVAAATGAVLEGCVAIGFAVEAYLVCCAYLAPSFPDEDSGGGWNPPDAPPDPWPPMDPAAAQARELARV